MTLQLTPQQQQAIDSQHGEPLVIVDPRSDTPYYLVPAIDYESVREILDDERTQRAIREAAIRTAGKRLQEDA